MTILNRLRGCYRRVLIFLVVIVVIGVIGSVFVYRSIGGREGARYLLAGYALNHVEKHLLVEKKKPNGDVQTNRPDGVSRADIEQTFEKVREANKNRQVDLIKLDRVLRAYQTQFKDTKPSTGEFTDFLMQLEATILTEPRE